ncbi:DsbA family protein [Erwinia tasmaniensis]|uniref:Thiol-disulfide isomerase n=1 Tax=Erwinia tasmaniensis (strain DSM 17950 / CFBP 7177 / CIP 109463 / NCPPB 4357 / Et1/99) TaxID=465817 RepID=B2VB37_ERWT9|nr:DsbA family protein [Erwinia tasmaniensis]CAO94973.1 Putative thiol-disulfide isomerase [Erwinia tasmaniensis Et1/99]
MKKLLALAIAASLLLSCTALADTGTTFSPAQQQEIQKITEQWLTAHPEILIKMGKKLQQRQQKAQQTQLSDGVVKLAAQLQQVKGIPHAGPEDASVIVTEFFDYQCVYCHRDARIVEKLIQDNPKVKFVFRDWPIFAGQYPLSNTAALTGIGIYREAGADAYLKYHNGIFATGHDEGKLREQDIADVAAKAMGKTPKLDDLKSYTATIDKNDMLAKAIGANGTPLFIVMPASNPTAENITVIPGAASLDVLQTAINHAR